MFMVKRGELGSVRPKASAWRDITIKNREEWAKVGHDLKLHDRQIRALTRHEKRPQAVHDDGKLLINFQVPQTTRTGIKPLRLSVIISKSEIITLHRPDMPIIEEISERVSLDRERRNSPSGTLSVLVDVVTEQFGPIIEYVDERIDNLEDAMIDEPTQDQLHKLFTLKQQLVDLRRIVTPTMSMLNGLFDGRYPLIDKKFVPYFRDSYDYTWRIHELVETLRDLLSSSLDTYLSVTSNRLNEVMKRLTIVATIFMPISFITGFGGMNFVKMPFRNDLVFFAVVALIISVPVLMLLYFRTKKWL